MRQKYNGAQANNRNYESYGLGLVLKFLILGLTLGLYYGRGAF